jgi:glutamate/tyrosine decarboxylase-like PLP-dependent enzyme
VHQVDRTTDKVIRSLVGLIERRLRVGPVPLDGVVRPRAELDGLLGELIGERPRDADTVLDVYTSVIAPTVTSADSPRFLGFIPAAPTKSSLAFDALVSASSLQGISWLEASGVIAAENSVLSLLAREAGLPPGAGGCFVSGGSAGNLSALAVARDQARSADGRRDRKRGGGRRTRVVVGTEAHSSILSTLRLLDLEPLVVDTPDHRLTAEAVTAALRADPDVAEIAAVVCTAGSANAGIIDDIAGIAPLARDHGWWLHVDGAYGGAGVFAPSLRSRFAGLELADSFIVDPHKWLFAPYDSCALLFRRPALAHATHTQQAPYLDVIHADDAEWNPADYAYHLTRRARGLPLWFSLAVHGLHAYREAIEASVRLACQTAELIERTDRLSLVCPPELGIVVFRRSGWAASDYHRWAQQLLEAGIAFVPPSTWEGETVGRLAFLHPDTTMDVVREILGRTA